MPPNAAAPATSRTELLEQARAALIELLGAERRLRARDQRAPSGALTNTQAWALAVLRDGERTVSEIAESTLTSPAATTVTLDQLEQRGVLERRRGTEDRRVCLVSLTPEGQRIVEEKRARSQALWREMLAGASDQEIAATVAVVRMIVELLDAH
jgi:MarR family transcriptional regulator, organic hydroperoxide resistance regulator